MSPIAWAWIETVGVVVLAALGVAGGWWCARWRGRWWLVGYFVPLAIVVSISLSRWFPWLELHRPFRWILAGRTEFALLAVVYTLLLTTLVSRLGRKRERVLLSVLMVACVFSQSVLAFLMPAFNYRQLTELKTLVDVDGVCIQSNGYTCGPAAAVTALRRVGVEAEEGELAILAHTTHMTGTQTDVLCQVIQKRYGVPCRQAYFRDISELRSCVPVVAIVKFAFLIDHFVTVLDVTEAIVVVGDPLVGRIEMTYEEFAKRWRRCGIVFDQPGRTRREQPGRRGVRRAACKPSSVWEDDACRPVRSLLPEPSARDLWPSSLTGGYVSRSLGRCSRVGEWLRRKCEKWNYSGQFRVLAMRTDAGSGGAFGWRATVDVGCRDVGFGYLVGPRDVDVGTVFFDRFGLDALHDRVEVHGRDN